MMTMNRGVEAVPNPDLDRRAALQTRLAELVNKLSVPEIVELESLLDAMARAHGLTWRGLKAPLKAPIAPDPTTKENTDESVNR
jgi:hypothetical protein